MRLRLRRIDTLAGTMVLVALLAIPAWSAPGKGGGKPSSPAWTLTLEDLAGDAIQSDGSGPYEASVTPDAYDEATTVVELGKKQEIWLDFSDCDSVAGLSCEGPFGPDASSGYVAGATFTFYSDVDLGVTERAGARVYFQTPEGRWKLVLSLDITAYDDDDDGGVDRYVLAHDGTTSISLGKFVNGRGVGQSDNYLEEGRFFMPWGAELTLQ
jgi:hypothetical protein